MKSAPLNLSNYKVSLKNEISKSWDQKYLLLGISGLKFKKILSYLKLARSNLSYWKILQKETKMLKSGTKNALFGHFWASFLKKYCHI